MISVSGKHSEIDAILRSIRSKKKFDPCAGEFCGARAKLRGVPREIAGYPFSCFFAIIPARDNRVVPLTFVPAIPLFLAKLMGMVH